MGRKPSIIIQEGQKFNTWKVVDNRQKEKYNYKYTCKCEICGREKEISKYALLDKTYALCDCNIETALSSRIELFQKYWNTDLNGCEFSPELFKKNPSLTYWFTCNNWHNYRSTLLRFNPSECPKCTPIKKESEVVDEDDTSFATMYPELLEYWNSMLNKVKPQDINCDSKVKIWFTCEAGHVFNTTANKITLGNWCPFCNNAYYENKIKAIGHNRALELYKGIKPNVPIGYLDYVIPIKLDLTVESIKTVFEFHTEKHKHYSPSYFRNEREFIELLDIDNEKVKWCKENGYRLVIVPLTGMFEKDVDIVLRAMI